MNSTAFVQSVGSLWFSPDNLLVSLDTVSLSTRVPPEPTLKFLETLFPPSVVDRFGFVLKSTYFSF